MVKNNIPVQRGMIFYVDFSVAKGSEQGGVRPALIVQNDIGNKYSPTTIVIPITSQQHKKPLPTHVELQKGIAGLQKRSLAMAEQIRIIDKSRMKEFVGMLNSDIMEQIDNALKVSIGVV